MPHVIFISYKLVSRLLKGREHQKLTQLSPQAIRRRSESGEFIFCVQLGSLEKNVALTGPYLTAYMYM